jgi:hypothetical protein
LSRIEIIRNRFLRRLHRAVFNTVPNNAPLEVDLSKLPPVDARDQGLDFSFALRVQATSNDAQAANQATKDK